jgi:hypothetical protein
MGITKRCVLLEMYHGTSAFRGKEEMEQLHEIFRICGTPNDFLWPSAYYTPNFANLKPRKIYPPSLKQFLLSYEVFFFAHLFVCAINLR